MSYPTTIDVFQATPVQTIGTPASVPSSIAALNTSVLAIESVIGFGGSLNFANVDGNNVRARSNTLVTPANSATPAAFVFANPVVLPYGQSGSFSFRVVGKTLVSGGGVGPMTIGDVFRYTACATFSNVAGTLAQVGSTVVTEAVSTGTSTSMASCTVSLGVSGTTVTVTVTPTGVSTTSNIGVVVWTATIEGVIEWSPVSGASAWWRADTLSGGPVASWTDLVNGYAAVQATGGSQMGWSATGGPNGVPCVTCNGSQWATYAGAITAASGWTTFAVLKPTNPAGTAEYIIHSGILTSGQYGWALTLNLDGSAHRNVAQIGSSTHSDTSSVATSTWEVWSVSLASVGATPTFNVNGAAQTMNNTISPQTPGAGFTIGAPFNGPPNAYNGSIEEIIVYGAAALAALPIGSVESYLRARCRNW